MAFKALRGDGATTETGAGEHEKSKSSRGLGEEKLGRGTGGVAYEVGGKPGNQEPPREGIF